MAHLRPALLALRALTRSHTLTQAHPVFRLSFIVPTTRNFTTTIPLYRAQNQPDAVEEEVNEPNLGAVRLIGDPILQRQALLVPYIHEKKVVQAREALHAGLEKFRRENGFGRAMSANQVGSRYRMIAMNMGKETGPFTLHNPEIVWRSEETFTIWDDCMSVPDYLVRVRRHKSISVKYINDSGEEKTLSKLNQSWSELLQHEIDHLDGVTMFERLEPCTDTPWGKPCGVVHRTVYKRDSGLYDSLVDYRIIPTV
eukprot:comp5083_c0_seq1/m.1173 comp5083_c0_seq1/g.1173  ORF comp5083_c0_seq1/g.1173 comp5083_c0_seq1/m.1173 type:complete len:255 (-) comp5083_c0_seq1:159-923(-)